MNCPKCGAELYRGDRYCEECGSPVAEYTQGSRATSGRHTAKHTVIVSIPYLSSVSKLRIPAAANRHVMICLACSLLWLLQIVYTFVKTIQVSVLGFVSHEYTSFSFFSIWSFADASVVPLIAVLLCALCCVNTLLPVLIRKQGRLTLFIVPKISAVLCALFWMITVGLAASAGKQTYGIAKPQFTLWLWLYIINCVSLLILSFVISGMSIHRRREARATQGTVISERRDPSYELHFSAFDNSADVEFADGLPDRSAAWQA